MFECEPFFVAPFVGVAPTWWLSGAAIDLDFANGRYYEGTDGQVVTDYLSCSRASLGYATNADGTLTQFANDTLRISDLGLLAEGARTNDVLWNRDLTNAAWAKTNITAAKDQTGVDGTTNSASSILAGAANATILQSITLGSAARYQSAWVKRITGSGTVNMTMDNGSTWTAITLTSNWTLVEIPTQTLANPIVGFRIVTSGDAIAVDFVQNENGNFASSPIPTTTTSATRAADSITFIGNAKTLLEAFPNSAVVDCQSLVSPANNDWNIISGGSGVSSDTEWMQARDNTIARLNQGTVGEFANTAVVGSFTSGLKVAHGINSTDATLVCGNATPATSAHSWSAMTNPKFLIGGFVGTWFGRARRATLFSSKVADATLQSLTAP